MAQRKLKPISYKDLSSDINFSFSKDTALDNKKLTTKAYVYTYNGGASIRAIDDIDQIVYVDEKYFPNPLMLWLRK